MKISSKSGVDQTGLGTPSLPQPFVIDLIVTTGAEHFEHSFDFNIVLIE